MERHTKDTNYLYKDSLDVYNECLIPANTGLYQIIFIVAGHKVGVALSNELFCALTFAMKTKAFKVPEVM